MKKVILSLIASFTLLTASAQFVLVNSPENIAGIYDFSVGVYEPDVTSGTWTADVVFVDDGSANPTWGCYDIVNAAAVNGKIALMDRGGCVYGDKLLKAQAAGAIAVVVFNTVPGGGTFDMSVNATHASLLKIPSVMLSYEAGQTIRAELAKGPVNMTIGLYKFPNDIGIGNSSVIHAPLGVVPAEQVTSNNFNLVPGANVANKGLNDAANVTVTATIGHQELEGGAIVPVYEQTATLDLIVAGDTGFVALPPYLPGAGPGVYYVEYQVASDSMEVPTADNQFGSKFILSENTYCKGGWDFDNNRPFGNNAYTISSGGSIEFLAGFDLPNGENVVLESIQFYVTSGAFGPSLGAIGLDNINGYVYEWTDANGDGRFNNNELEMVAKAPVKNVDASLKEAWVTAPILELTNLDEGYHVPGDNKKYIVGVRYEGAYYVFFGFDDDYDHQAFMENAYATDLDLPYFVVTSWNGGLPNVDGDSLFLGYYGSVATALKISVENVSAEEPSALTTASVSLYPNPATDFLMVKLTGEALPQQVVVQVFNSIGVMIRQFALDAPDFSAGLRVDVSDLGAGFYTLKIGSEGPFADGKFLKID